MIIGKSKNNTVSSILKIPKPIDPVLNKNFLYFCRIGEPQNRLYKIGTTNNIIKRMLEHCRYFKQDIDLLWLSPKISKFTALRIEEQQKRFWIDNCKTWEYLKNDRFKIPTEEKESFVKIRKIYPIKIL